MIWCRWANNGRVLLNGTHLRAQIINHRHGDL